LGKGILNCSNEGEYSTSPRGHRSFKNLLQHQQANFDQTSYKLFLGKGNPKFQIKGQILFKGETITKMGGVIYKSSQDSLSRKSSYLHENFLISCSFKFVQIMVYMDLEGPQ
jgi:hypothetical protein